MKIGKLEHNSRGWFWDNRALFHPIRILWNLFMFPIYYFVLFIFCVVNLMITFDIRDFRDLWRSHSLF